MVTPVVAKIFGATMYSVGTVAAFWLGAGVWRGRRLGWAMGLMSFYVASYGFSLTLELSQARIELGPTWFIGVRILVLVALLASFVLTLTTVVHKSPASGNTKSCGQ